MGVGVGEGWSGIGEGTVWGSGGVGIGESVHGGAKGWSGDRGRCGGGVEWG